jgi:hypothetical protein
MKAAPQNYINHIVLAVDTSGSMAHLTEEMTRVIEGQIAYLARRSTELDQETRVTVYTFNDTAQCVIFDKDVLRLPSLRQFMHAHGRTALIDATMKARTELALTSEIYGDHAFLIFVLTDGEENASRQYGAGELSFMLRELPDHWTVAVLVPDQRGKFEAKRWGFPADNIAVWDATTREGLVEAGNVIRVATDTFMESRSSGVRGSRSIFSTAPSAVNKVAVAAAGLKPLAKSAYLLIPVTSDMPVKEFVEAAGHRFQVGKVFYPLMKTESIQANKDLAVVE